MKRKYETPKVYIQDMAVNSFVAGACSDDGVAVLDHSENDCYYYDDESGMTLFSAQCSDDEGWGADIINPNPQSPFAQICYHRPLDASNFFSS